jgi:hypothetical protein
MHISKNFEKYKNFRSIYDRMTYENHHFTINQNAIEIQFTFTIDDTFIFQPITNFEISDIPFKTDNKQLDYLIFHIGMSELISYWKAICPQKVIIKPYILTEKQINWWKKLYFNGLGEFFYLNGIDTDIDNFMHLYSPNGKDPVYCNYHSEKEGVILPIGGGKDSIVSLEFFKFTKKNIFPMLVNPRHAMTDSIYNAGLNSYFHIKRTIAPALLELNAQGFLNGHTPFSSVLAFQSVLLSYLTGIHNIALSNESSANEPTVQNSKVNHQYSKSHEFEHDFRWYSQQYMMEDVNYYSVLRPLSELQIAYIFSKFPQYFDSFKSCNAGSKKNIWCCNCPKCLFTAIMLHAFLPRENLYQIFGSNLFENTDLLYVFNQLIGLENEKPFECVGTIDEVRIALLIAIDKYYSTSPLPFLLDYFKNSEIYSQRVPFDLKKKLFKEFDNTHFLPQAQYEELTRFIKHFAC